MYLYDIGVENVYIKNFSSVVVTVLIGLSLNLFSSES